MNPLDAQLLQEDPRSLIEQERPLVLLEAGREVVPAERRITARISVWLMPKLWMARPSVR